MQYLRQQDNRVTLYRSRFHASQPARTAKPLLTLEQRGEVEILRNSNIKEIEDDGGRACISFAEPEHASRTFDRVIFALGGTTPTNFLHTLGITFNGDGPVFDEAGATNVDGLYLIGDLVVGKKGGSIITAFNSAVRAMKSICIRDLACQSRSSTVN